MTFTALPVPCARKLKTITPSAAILTALILLSCQSTSISNFQTPEKNFGENETLNYEYANTYYAEEIRNAHFLLNIEIEKPLIIKIELPKMDLLHRSSPICGTAIVKISTDSGGAVVSYTFVKRAGLDLDGYVDEMLKSAKIKPLYLRGERGASDFLARFIFTEGHK
jgi:hypothetical protein